MKTTLVITTTGERFEVRGQNNDGVEFDGGVILWHEVAAFLCWHEKSRKWMTIPL